MELILTTLGSICQSAVYISNFLECSPQSLMIRTLLLVSCTILELHTRSENFPGVTVPTTSTTTTTTTPAPTLPVSATSPLSTDTSGVIGSTTVSSSTTTTMTAGDAGRIGQDGK